MNLPPRRNARGFGLIELMLTLVLVTLVLGGIMSVFFSTSHQADRLTKVADERQSARTAIQLIEREVRMAGSGWGRVEVYANDSNGVGDTLLAVNPGFTTTAGNDSLVLIGAWQATTTLMSDMSLPSSLTRVKSNSGFVDGDLFILTNGTSRAHMLMCTGTTGADIINHATTSLFNGSTGTMTGTWPPSGGYPDTVTNVYKATITSYYYDTSTYRKPALMRHEYGSAPQVVAYGVDGFRVFYEMQDGTKTRNPANMDDVDKVSPVVYTRVTDPRRATLRDSVWAAVQPRTF
jgi:type II secretory pathway pseudopilin PulG